MRHLADRRLITRVAAAGVLVALAATGCSSSKKSGDAESSSTASSSSSGSASSSSSDAISGTVTVLAAASLTEAFTTLKDQFEKAHPGVTVKISFGASSDLATQIINGAPADVFASASAKNMKQVTDAKDAADPSTFAKNVMEIAVPPKNPANITSVNDLAKSGVKVALCQAAVPCGATALTVFKNAKITVKPVTLEADVKSTLAKVELGEVDAGVVYVTDVRAAKTKVKGIEISPDVNASTSYPIATLTKAPNSAAAEAFTDYVLSADGQAALTADGFAKP